MKIANAKARYLISALLKQEGLVLVTVGNASAVALGALLWFAVARWLSVSDYGRLNYLISLASLASSMATLGLPAVLQTYVPRGEEELTAGAIGLSLLASLAVGGPLYFVDPLLPIVTASSTLFSIAAGDRLGFRDYRGYALLQVGSKSILLWWVVLLVPRLGREAALWGFALIPLLSSAWMLTKLKHLRRGFELLRRHVRFAIATFTLGLTTAVGLRLDRVVIGYLYGDATLGYYQLAYQFFMALSVIPGSLRAYLLSEKSSGRSTRVAEILGMGAAVMAAGVGVAMSPIAIRMFFPQFYPGSARAAQVASLAVIPAAVFSIWTAGKLSSERPLPVLAINVASLCAFMLAILTLGRSFGVTGLAAALLTYRLIAAIAGIADSARSR